MYAQVQTVPVDPQPPLHPLPLLSPWAQRTLRFLKAWSDFGAGPVTLDDLRPLFALAPRGELALTVDALCSLQCLEIQDDGSFRIGSALPSLAPRPSRFAAARP